MATPTPIPAFKPVEIVDSALGKGIGRDVLPDCEGEGEGKKDEGGDGEGVQEDTENDVVVIRSSLWEMLIIGATTFIGALSFSAGPRRTWGLKPDMGPSTGPV